jgi:hypothetical protein
MKTLLVYARHSGSQAATLLTGLMFFVIFGSSITAQEIGYLSPRGGSAFVAPAGSPFTQVDFSHPATSSGTLTTATVWWSQAPSEGCTAAMKVKLIRPAAAPFGNFSVVAERGPFNVLNGFNTVGLVPPVPVSAGDYLAIVQTRGEPCGGMVIAAAEPASTVFQFQSDLVSGSFATGNLRTGHEFGARASAGSSVLTHVIPVVGSVRGGFGSNFKTAAQIFNPTPYPIKGKLVFHPAGRSALPGDPSLDYNIANFQTASYEDVVAQMGQSGLGSIDVLSTSSPAPIVTVRIYNDLGTAGTAGFVEETVRPRFALHQGEIAHLAIPADTTNFRLNIGVRTLDAGATLVAFLVDPNGFPLVSSPPKTYGANFFEQTSGSMFFNNTPLPPGGRIMLIQSSGTAIVYASTTDNRTNDSFIQFAARR